LNDAGDDTGAGVVYVISASSIPAEAVDPMCREQTAKNNGQRAKSKRRMVASTNDSLFRE
jgi:hypothetical protein